MYGYFFQEGIGTVYHYLEPSRKVECHRETVKTAVSCLEYKFKSEFEEEIMKVKRCVKESFVVIGKEGSTLDGEGFIQRLWVDANSHFGEVQHLAKKDENGNISGIWGAMSDFSHSFNPWEDFNKGLYLAGVECRDDAEAPNGWTKRIIPGYEYIYIECENNAAFSAAIKYLEDNGIPLVGAVHDFICPQTGKILYRL